MVGAVFACNNAGFGGGSDRFAAISCTLIHCRYFRRAEI
jgi:hypothetical protein